VLPKQGFDYEQYTHVLFDIDDVWTEYLKAGRDWDPAITHLLTMSVIQQELRLLNVPDENHRQALQKAIALLDKALGPQVLTELLCHSNVKTMSSMLRSARSHSDSPPPQNLGQPNLQVTFLTHAIGHIVMHCGGRNPYQMLIRILDSLYLPFTVHQVIHTHVSEQIKAVKRTHH